jgi:hypothetical protein
MYFGRKRPQHPAGPGHGTYVDLSELLIWCATCELRTLLHIWAADLARRLFHKEPDMPVIALESVYCIRSLGVPFARPSFVPTRSYVLLGKSSSPTYRLPRQRTLGYQGTNSVPYVLWHYINHTWQI